VIGWITFSRIQNQERAAFQSGPLLRRLHQQAADAMAPMVRVSHQFGDLGSVSAIRFGTQLQLNGSDDPFI
jgi:hypothetical protein